MDIVKSSIISLYGAQNSMQGGRPENQDDMGFLDTPLGFLLLICDGMGGGPGGKTASYIVKHEVGVALSECRPETDRMTALKMAIGRAQEALAQKMREVPSLNGMGSTIVALLINKHSAIIAHAGDSRCYRLHGRRCLYRSQDHSLVAELVKRKVMTEEQARVSPQSNVITRGLGYVQDNVPEIDEVPYLKGDRFILCTDGIWGIMPHKELLARFAEKIDIQSLVANLSAEVDRIGIAAGGHHDNHTIAVIEMGENSALMDVPGWRKKMLFAIPIVIFSVLLSLGIISLINHFYHKDEPEPTPANHTSEYVASNGSAQPSSHVLSVDSPLTAKSLEEKPLESDSLRILYNQKKNTLKRGEDSSIVSKNKSTEEDIYASSIEKVQKLINRYDSAKVVTAKSVSEAQEKLNHYHDQINSLMNDLLTDSLSSDARSKAEAIQRVIDNKTTWVIDKPKNGKCGVTGKAKNEMSKQIERLMELKEILLNDQQEKQKPQE